MSEPDSLLPRRADAVRNRARIIAAAEAEFREHGLDAGIPEIAARAGVGKGTIYRNFESKDELLAAVIATRMEEFDRAIVVAQDESDPERALRQLLGDAAARTSAVTLPVGIAWPMEHPRLDEVRRRVTRHMGELFSAGQAAGGIRPEATVKELFILFGGTLRALKADEEQDPEVWRRHANLVLDAFRQAGGPQEPPAGGGRPGV